MKHSHTHVDYVRGSMFGGILFSIGLIIMMEQIIQHLVDVSLSCKAEFTTEEKYYDSDEMSKIDVSLGKYNDSMVFAFGFASYEPGFDPVG